MSTSERDTGTRTIDRRKLISSSALTAFGAWSFTAPWAYAGLQDDSAMTVLQAEDVSTMDPHLDWTVSGRNIYYQVFGTLALGDSNLIIQPDLAESWTIDSDEAITFHLRQGVKFHDGSEFTSADVKFSLERILDPEFMSPWSSVMQIIDSIETPDPQTVVVTTKTANATALIEIGRMCIVPASYIAEVGDEGFAAKPIGTGPYKFVEWTPGEDVVLEAYTDYWRGAPTVQRVSIRAVPENLTRVTELVTGGADLVTKVPPELISEVEGSGSTHIVSIPSIQNVYLGLNTTTGPLGDVRVRQALNHGIDIELLIDAILGGNATRVTGPLSPLVWGSDPSLTGYAYDPEKAHQLLSEAGYADGFETTLSFGQGRILKAQELAEAISTELSQFNITVKVQPVEWGVYYEAFAAGKIEGMFLQSVTATTGDPDAVFKFLDPKRTGSYYDSPELNELVQQQFQTVDAEKRIVIVGDIQQYLIDNAPWVFMFDLNLMYGVSNRIEYVARPNELIWLEDVTFA